MIAKTPLPNDLLAKLSGEGVPHSDPLILYGSCARGDATPSSDIDVLRVASCRERSREISGQISLHTYTENDLADAARRGSLFVLHIVSEGIPLRDNGILQRLTDSFTRPRSYLDREHRNLTGITELCNVDTDLFASSPRAFLDAATFATRTLLYADYADRGTPTFSLKTLARTDTRAKLAQRAKQQGSNHVDYAQLCNAIGTVLGQPRNQPATSFKTLAQRIPPKTLCWGLLQRIIRRSAHSPYIDP